MSWTDRSSIKVIKFLRDKYKIKTFVETGTYRGINARLHSNNFERVMTCEKSKKYCEIAKERLKHCLNVILLKEDSPSFLKRFNSERRIFYLDAHFYDPKAKNKFVVLKELKSLTKQKNSIIIIHDFDNGLGHITYDGQPLDFELLKKDLLNINKFHFYTNELSSCDIVTPMIRDIESTGLEVDRETIDNLEYAWTKPEKTYRGILYCLPSKLSSIEMNNLGLKSWS